MNRKLYEAVPVEEWKKKSSMKEVPGLDSNGDINMVIYFPDYGTFYFVETDKEIGTKTNNGSNIITHILVAVEEVDKWISPLPDDKECEDWYNENIGDDPEKPCSASSAIYKFREWIKERDAANGIHKESALKFMTWYNRNEKRSKILYERFLNEVSPSAPKQDKQDKQK